jgi:hypothetical protein
MSSNDQTLRELFEACKTGDLVKVKKLLTPQNVNAIGDKFELFNLLFHFCFCSANSLYFLKQNE